MFKYEIMVTLFTIVYGLMLTDLFFSFHKLIRKRKYVKWHWLPLLAAWYLFLIILKNWWDLTSFESGVEWMNIVYFLAYGHLLFLIFLAVSTVLPDDIQQNEISLKDYYFSNHRYFWGLMTSVVVLSTVISSFKQLHHTTPVNYYNLLSVSIYIILLIVLTISKKYLVHSVLLILFVILTIIEILYKKK